MTIRGVVRHVRYWRGTIHRWSTVYQFVGTPSSPVDLTDAQNLLAADDAMCYQGASVQGGTYECQLYNQASGGVPLVTYTRFDWETPGSWIGYSGSAWTTTALQSDGEAEAALVTEYPAGLSKTGKPVILRKWYHAVPASVANGANPQVSAADLASLQAGAAHIVGIMGAKGLVLGSQTGRFAGTARVLAYYGNHQMPRGRRTRLKVESSSDLGNFLKGLLDQKAGQAAGS